MFGWSDGDAHATPSSSIVHAAPAAGTELARSQGSSEFAHTGAWPSLCQGRLSRSPTSAPPRCLLFRSWAERGHQSAFSFGSGRVWLLGRQAYPNGRWEEEKEIRGIFSPWDGWIVPVLEPNIRMTPPNQTHPQGSVETLIS